MQIGVYPAVEPFGKKIRSALKEAGIRWVCLKRLLEPPESLALLLINVAALESGENDLKTVLEAVQNSPLRSVPTVLLDPPNGEVMSGWAEGYEARLSLALSSAQIARIIQKMLHQLQLTRP